MSKERIQFNLITEGTKESISAIVRSHSTALFAVHREEARERGTLIGSGTFVSIGLRKFILTARHVLQCSPFRNCETIGLSLTPGEHGPKIDRRFVRAIVIPQGSGVDGTPDLGLLEIAPSDASMIERYKTFYSLSELSRNSEHELAPATVGFWVAFGCPEQMAGTEFEGEHFKHVRMYPQLLYQTHVVLERGNDGWDLIELPIDIKAELSHGHLMPTRLGGMSGGGLWHIVVQQLEGQEIIVNNPYLAGVAIRESALDGSIRFLVGHGQRSIYERMMEYLKTNHPEVFK